MTQIRPHLSDYQESMKLVFNVQTIDDVVAFIRCRYPQWRPDIRQMAQIPCGIDKRNGWDTWLIKLRGQPAIWMDGPIADVQTFGLVKSG